MMPLWEPWAVAAGWLKLASAVFWVPSVFLAWRILRYAVDAPSRDRLEAANRALRDLNQRLEQCVVKRTRALSAAGRRLVVAVHPARAADRIKTDFLARKFGRASCREEVLKYVEISVVARSLK